MKNLLLSFSGGETSAYMTQWCLANMKDEYNMVVVFANTGEEREETLEFVHKCDEILDFNTVWVEAVVQEGRAGTKHKVVDFETASRNGEPFEEVIQKYGIPNQAYPHCTRELKKRPIQSYVKNDLGWKGYYTAIGIRIDEVDRINDEKEKNRYIYPLAETIPTNRQKINKYWSDMPFRLELKSYEGNCKACWKKSNRKLYTIYKNDPSSFDNMIRWEKEYGKYIKEGRADTDKTITFFRYGRSALDIIKEAEEIEVREPIDESMHTEYQSSFFDEDLDVGFGCNDSCEPF